MAAFFVCSLPQCSLWAMFISPVSSARLLMQHLQPEHSYPYVSSPYPTVALPCEFWQYSDACLFPLESAAKNPPTQPRLSISDLSGKFLAIGHPLILYCSNKVLLKPWCQPNCWSYRGRCWLELWHCLTLIIWGDEDNFGIFILWQPSIPMKHWIRRDSQSKANLNPLILV